MKAKLITYNMSKLDQYHRVLVNRALFGYLDNSNKGQYQYKRKGVLADIPNFRILKGAVIIQTEDQSKVISVLKKEKVEYNVYDIGVKKSMLKKKAV